MPAGRTSCRITSPRLWKISRKVLRASESIEGISPDFYGWLWKIWLTLHLRNHQTQYNVVWGFGWLAASHGCPSSNFTTKAQVTKCQWHVPKEVRLASTWSIMILIGNCQIMALNGNAGCSCRSGSAINKLEEWRPCAYSGKIGFGSY